MLAFPLVRPVLSHPLRAIIPVLPGEELKYGHSFLLNCRQRLNPVRIIGYAFVGTLLEK
jgi:hypothetical protein